MLYVDADRQSENKAFETLAKFICGFNKKRGESGHDEIAMTAPVRVTPGIQAAAHDEIAMTSPVMSRPVASAGATTRVCGVPSGADTSALLLKRMEFVMPASRFQRLDQLPHPEDDQFVQLIEQPAELVAVLTYSWAPDNIEKKRREQASLSIVCSSFLFYFEFNSS